MNAKLKKEINKTEAYNILERLYETGYWDPVVTAFMTENQCLNKLVAIIQNYFKTHKTLIYWNANSYLSGLEKNKEFAPLMQHYEFNKYKESLEDEQNK